jgi:hypothetical protein
MLTGQLGISHLCRQIAAHRRSEKISGREQDGKGSSGNDPRRSSKQRKHR